MSIVVVLLAASFYFLFNLRYLQSVGIFLDDSGKGDISERMTSPALLNLGFILFCYTLQIPLFFMYLLTTALILIETFLLFPKKKNAAILCGGTYMICSIGVKMMLDSIFSTVLTTPFAHIQREAMGRAISVLGLAILLTVIVYLVKRNVSFYDLELLLANKMQMSFTTIATMFLLGLMIALNAFVATEENFQVVNLVHFSAVAIILFCYYMLLRYSINISRTMWFKEHTELVEGTVVADRAFEANMYLYSDRVTGLHNKQYGITKLDELCSAGVEFALSFVCMDDYKGIQKTYGGLSSDYFAMVVAKVLKNTFRNGDVICRIEDEWFMIILKNCPQAAADKTTGRAFHLVGQESRKSGKSFPLSIHFGSIVISKQQFVGAVEILEFAETKMDEFKGQRKTLMDPTTGLFNQSLLLNTMENICYEKNNVSIISIIPTNTRNIEEDQGIDHLEQYYKDLGATILETAKPDDIVGRYEPNLFMIIIAKESLSQVELRQEIMVNDIIQKLGETKRTHKVEISTNLVHFGPKTGENPAHMFNRIKKGLHKLEKSLVATR